MKLVFTPLCLTNTPLTKKKRLLGFRIASETNTNFRSLKKKCQSIKVVIERTRSRMKGQNSCSLCKKKESIYHIAAVLFLRKNREINVISFLLHRTFLTIPWLGLCSQLPQAISHLLQYSSLLDTTLPACNSNLC